VKGWTSATMAGSCAYDRAHTWTTGERIVVLQGVGWQKLYCAACGQSRHGVGADTGEILERAAPPRPKLQMALAKQIADRFDVRAAQARNDA
jgi:hypothetical protein